ncbi:Calx-beta domain-containing protein [Paenibacillus solisilvae]|uniref:Calx-beta domain-containing protein n=1 Tax=Paenibacillus solisilvae TaxID=2486751 RepID=A0ABW0W3U4_9BACL
MPNISSTSRMKLGLQAMISILLVSLMQLSYFTQFVSADVIDTSRIQLEQGTYYVNEEAESVAVQVLRKDGLEEETSVDYTTKEGTASNDSDYSEVSGTLTFGVGETSKTIIIPVNDDLIDENNEIFSIYLSNPTNGTLLGSQVKAIVIITDNDPVSVIKFESPNYYVVEESGLITLTITRTGNTNGAVNIVYSAASDTAAAGFDFARTYGNLTMADGETTKTFQIKILDDNQIEYNEKFLVEIDCRTVGTWIGSIAWTKVNILDQDHLKDL